jgi:septal ring factor EnvC (AmiA/AmiB activator)
MVQDRTVNDLDSVNRPRPTLWIALAAIFGLAAIGLGIWAFSTKSDLDTANDTIASQKKVDKATLAKARKTQSQLSGQIKAEDVKAKALKGEADRREKNLKTAQANVASATSAADKADAELKVATAQQEAATTCAKAALSGLGDLLGSSSPKSAIKSATEKLAASQTACNSASG